MIKVATLAALGFAAVSALPAEAQSGRNPPSAAERLAPPTFCRIWHRGLPADQQPPPTDCATARRQLAITGGQLVVGTGEPGGAFRVSEWPDRYRREVERLDARDRARERRDRAYDESVREFENRMRCVDVDNC